MVNNKLLLKFYQKPLILRHIIAYLAKKRLKLPCLSSCGIILGNNIDLKGMPVFVDWLMENLLFIWLLIAMFFLLLEMGVPGLFFFLSFFFGALITAFSTFFTDSLAAQAVIFLIASGISFLVLHFWVKKKIGIARKESATNIYALEGKRAKVIKPILPVGVGQVKIFGEIWSARSHTGEAISENEIVEIVNVKGSHLVVIRLGKR